MLLVAKLLGDSLASGESARLLRVPIMLFALYYLNDRLIYGRRQFKTVCSRGLTKTKIAEGFLVVLGQGHLALKQLTDGIDDVGAGCGAVLHLGPGGGVVV